MGRRGDGETWGRGDWETWRLGDWHADETDSLMRSAGWGGLDGFCDEMGREGDLGTRRGGNEEMVFLVLKLIFELVFVLALAI